MASKRQNGLVNAATVDSLTTRIRRISFKVRADRRVAAVTSGHNVRVHRALSVSVTNKWLAGTARRPGKLTAVDVETAKLATAWAWMKVAMATVEDVAAGRVDAAGSPHNPVRLLTAIFNAMSLKERITTPRRESGDRGRVSVYPYVNPSSALDPVHDTKCALAATRHFIASRSRTPHQSYVCSLLGQSAAELSLVQKQKKPLFLAVWFLQFLTFVLCFYVLLFFCNQL